MTDAETVRALLLAQPSAEETYPFDPVTLVAKVGGKMFGLLSLDEAPTRLTLKVEPDHGAWLRDTYPAIGPGYHMDKRHWVTLTLDGSLDATLVQGLIAESHRLVVRGLPRAVRERLTDGGANDANDAR